MRRVLTLLAVSLPVVGTLLSIAAREWELRGATEWRIPVTGFDPGDPLRGRYIQFRYRWTARGDPARCRSGDGCQLCLEAGGAAAAIVPVGRACAAPVDPRASGLVLTRGWDDGPNRMSAASRLWVPEARAAGLDRQLGRQPMVAVVRVTRGGRLIAERLAPARR